MKAALAEMKCNVEEIDVNWRRCIVRYQHTVDAQFRNGVLELTGAAWQARDVIENKLKEMEKKGDDI